MPADLQRARELFLHAVGKLPPEQWDAYLAEACGPDAELQRHVLHLLQVHREAGSFLERPAAAVQATGAFTPSPEDEAAAVPTEAAGTAIGPYKLIEAIGEGGMGTVWMAQQTAPVKRLVALKVIKPGMDSKQVLARFEAERQALALMDHPNIARVLDAGTTGGGRPYFVMELVKGVPLTGYCDEHRLTPRQRLELFVPVCQAVQHAHQKGIIHRDLKPSNVLVAQYDGRPVPKVIDFGIAKATGQQLTEHTLVTGFGAVVGTLEYMSPEQAELNQLDIDTRSDIYSLGVLLYELLTGSTPLEKKRLKEAALLEVLRVIREEEPPRPSTRLSTTDELPSVAANRGLEPRKLSGLVRGELDWIVMKALEKDRNRRYETATGFAQDVQRYLADEPVQACPPSMAYRLRKFVRRNRGQLVFAAGVCVLVAAVLGSIGWAVRDRAVREEEKQREQVARQGRAANELALALDRAELFQGQGQRAEALAALERAELLASEAPADPAQGARLAAVREGLAAEAHDQKFIARIDDIRLRVLGRFEVRMSSSSNEAAITAIQEALRRYRVAIGMMAPAQAAAYIRGRPKAARRALITALNECLLVLPPGEAEARPWLFATLDAADSDAWRVQMRKAYPGNLEALAQMARAVDVREQPPRSLLFAASCLSVQGGAAWLEFSRRIQRAYPADFWANYGLALVLEKNGQPAEAVRYYHAALALRPDSPEIYLGRGLALQEAGEVDAAIADYRQSFALAPQYAEPHNNLGSALWAKGRLDEAIDEYREAIRLKKDLPQAHYNLGRAMISKGRPDEAIAEYQKAIQLKMDYGEAHYHLGVAMHGKGRLDEAITEYQKAILFKMDYANVHYLLGLAMHGKGQLYKAIAEYEKAIQLKKDFSEAHNRLGGALADYGLLDEAITEYHEAIRLKKDDPEAHNNLGGALYGKGRLEEAIAEYHEAIRLKKDFPEAHNNLGLALSDKGQLDEAITEYREAIRLKKDGAEAHHNLGNALYGKGQLDEAIAQYRAALQLNKDYPRAGERLREAEQMAALRKHLPAVLEGKHPPRDAAEALAFARHCQRCGRHYASAARFFAQAFAAQPALAEDLEAGDRYNAACAAALAGCGQGQDAPALGGPERARLRRQALDWLRADWKAYRPVMEKSPDQVPPKIVQRMQHWLQDTDFAGVRGSQALARLPEAERNEWHTLWKEVEALRQRAAEHQRGELSFALGRWQQAVADYSRVIALEPKNAAAWYMRAIAYRKMGMRDTALHDYSRAIELNPGNPYAWYYRAEIHGELGQWEKAAADFSRSLELHPQNPAAWNQRAQAYQMLGRWDRVVENYSQAITVAGSTGQKSMAIYAPMWQNELAWLLATCPEAKVRNPARAVALAQQLVDANPKGGAFWKTLGVARYRAGDWKAARAALVKSRELARGPDALNAFFLAMTHWQLGDKDEARKWYDRALERMSMNEELWPVRAEAAALMGIGHPLPPFAEVRKSIDQAPALAGKGQWQKAAAEYARAVDAFPDEAGLWLEYASALLLADNPEGYRRASADIHRRLAAVTDPDTCYGLARIASLAPGGGDPAEAVQRAEKGVAAHAKQAWYLHTLAVAHYRAGQFDQAVRRAEQSLKDDPAWGGHVVDWLLLAMAHQRLGHGDEARHWLDKAVQWIDQAGKGLPKESSFALPVPSWGDRLEIHLLRREAKKLIGGQ